MPTGKDDGDFKKEFWLDLQKQAISKFKGMHFDSVIATTIVAKEGSKGFEYINRLVSLLSFEWNRLHHFNTDKDYEFTVVKPRFQS